MIRIIIGALATWRIAHMLVWEEGPGAVFSQLRDAVGIRRDDYSNCVSDNPHQVMNLFCCVWCASVWVGWIIAFLMGYKKNSFEVGLALSAGAVLLEEFREGRD